MSTKDELKQLSGVAGNLALEVEELRCEVVANAKANAVMVNDNNDVDSVLIGVCIELKDVEAALLKASRKRTKEPKK